MWKMPEEVILAKADNELPTVFLKFLEILENDIVTTGTIIKGKDGA